MAFVRSFFVSEDFGVPDNKIREWLSIIEKLGTLHVQTTWIPPHGEQGAKFNVIAVVVDDPLEKDETEIRAELDALKNPDRRGDTDDSRVGFVGRQRNDR